MYREDIQSKVESSVRESISFTVTMLGTSGIIVEGHRGIGTYSRECIRLRINKKHILIEGTNLVIRDINDRDIYIIGKISGVHVDE